MINLKHLCQLPEFFFPFQLHSCLSSCSSCHALALNFVGHPKNLHFHCSLNSFQFASLQALQLCSQYFSSRMFIRIEIRHWSIASYMFSKNCKNNYICVTLKTRITNITFCWHPITTIVTIEFGLEEKKKFPSHPWTSSKDIQMRMLVNPLFVAMENNPKLDWGGHARNMCKEKKKAFMLDLYNCNVGQVWTMQKIFIWENLGFFLKVCDESLEFYGGKPWSLT